jgi:hypothetical protein
MNCVYHDHEGEQCEREPLTNYPLCLVHAREKHAHTAKRPCLHPACNPAREAAPIANPAQIAWAINSMLARPLPAPAIHNFTVAD